MLSQETDETNQNQLADSTLVKHTRDKNIYSLLSTYCVPKPVLRALYGLAPVISSHQLYWGKLLGRAGVSSTLTLQKKELGTKKLRRQTAVRAWAHHFLFLQITN